MTGHSTRAGGDQVGVHAVHRVGDDSTGQGLGLGRAGGLAPTDRWLAAAASYMPALEGPAGLAERLLLLIHYGVDWEGGWVGRYRSTYWDQLLPDRIITATYRIGNLRRWWRDVADELGSRPRNAAERAELEQLLRADPLPVLEVLRYETEALLLRTRIVTEAVREARGASVDEVPR